MADTNPTDPVALTRATADRMARAIHWAENDRPTQAYGDLLRKAEHRRQFWARITDNQPLNPSTGSTSGGASGNSRFGQYKYAWKEVERTEFGFRDVYEGRSGDADCDFGECTGDDETEGQQASGAVTEDANFCRWALCMEELNVKGAAPTAPVNVGAIVRMQMDYNGSIPRYTFWRWAGTKLGKVVCFGPCGCDKQPDYDDNRYWVQLLQIKAAGQDDPIEYKDDDPMPHACDSESCPDPLPRIVTVTNLAESNENTHFVPQGTLLEVDGTWDEGGTLRYYTSYMDTEGETGPCDCSSSSSSSKSSSSSSGSKSSSSLSFSSSSSSSSSSKSHSSGSSGSGSGSGSNGSGSNGSGSNKSTAIVPASWSPTGYTALFISEMPEVRFDDVVIISVPQTDGTVPIDPKFIEVCEAGTLQVCGCTPDEPILVGAKVKDNAVSLRFANQSSTPVQLVIRLTGIRKGFLNMRFPDRTRTQFLANERFLRSAYDE